VDRDREIVDERDRIDRSSRSSLSLSDHRRFREQHRGGGSTSIAFDVADDASVSLRLLSLPRPAAPAISRNKLRDVFDTYKRDGYFLASQVPNLKYHHSPQLSRAKGTTSRGRDAVHVVSREQKLLLACNE